MKRRSFIHRTVAGVPFAGLAVGVRVFAEHQSAAPASPDRLTGRVPSCCAAGPAQAAF
jgi:hypothetical protein